MKKEKPFNTILNEGIPTAAERKAKMDAVKAMSLDELIDKYMPDSFINDNGELQCEHHRFCGPTFGDWLYFKKDGIYWNCRRGNQISNEIFEKQYEWHPGDKLTGSYNDLAMISNCTEIPIYVLKLIFEKFNVEMRISESKMKRGDGTKLIEKRKENTMKKLFENGNSLFDYVLNESSSSLKESECSLEWLLDKAYVSEYRMVGKNFAEVRVRHTPELLTSDSMAARFAEDIPDGYRLEVDFLGEDPILGRNFDIYEVQLLKD